MTFRSSLVCAVLLVAQVTGLQAQGTQETSTIVAGRVINGATGAPIARVLVQGNNGVAFTDHDGRFAFPDSGPAANLQLTKPGFASSPEQMDQVIFSVPPAGRAAAADFALWPEAILTGTVLGPEGDPIPRLNVSASRTLYENGVRRSQPAGFGITDSHGNFRIPVPAGDYALETRYNPPGVSSPEAVLPVEVPAHSADASGARIHIGSGQELHFDLRPGIAQAYHFTLPFDSLPERQVPAISLQTGDGAVYQPGGLRHSPSGLTMDLPAGTYRLTARIFTPEGLRAGDAVINVPNHDATGPTVHVEAVSRIPVELSLDPADRSSGDAATRESDHLPNANALNLQLDPVSGSGGSLGDSSVRLTSREGGAATLSAPPGTYRLSAGEGSGWLIKSATFAGTDLLRDDLVVSTSGGSEPLRLVVSHRAGTITGITRLGGVAAPCWVVLVSNAAALPRFFTRRSDAEGRLDISGVGPGTYRALAMPYLHSADYANPAVLDRFRTYVAGISVDPSSTASVTLEAVPAEELFR